MKIKGQVPAESNLATGTSWFLLCFVIYCVNSKVQSTIPAPDQLAALSKCPSLPSLTSLICKMDAIPTHTSGDWGRIKDMTQFVPWSDSKHVAFLSSLSLWSACSLPNTAVTYFLQGSEGAHGIDPRQHRAFVVCGSSSIKFPFNSRGRIFRKAWTSLPS